MKHLLYLISGLALAACNFKSKQADLIIFNTSGIHTMIPGDEPHQVQAIAIKDGKIVATGKEREILNQYRYEEKLDAQKGHVYPGFHDAHCHFLGYALNLYRCDLGKTRSLEDVVETLHDFKLHNPRLTWLVGRGYDQTLWNEKAPHKKYLDALFPDIPVVLQRVDGHAVWVNTKALEVANITSDTHIAGGIIEKDAEGLTGILLENAGEFVLDLVPEPSEKLKRDALIRAQAHCFAAGLTHLTDAGLPWKDIRLLEQMQADSSLRIGLNVMVQNKPEDIDSLIQNGKINTPNFKVHSIKVYGDGSLGSRSACLKKPYSDHAHHHGITVIHTDSLARLAQKAIDHDLQINLHSIGDSTSAMILHTFESLLEANNDRRWRIEHAQVLDKKDYETMRHLRIIPSVQPTHATSDRRWAIQRVGKERADRIYAYQSLLKLQGLLPLGTDFPVEEIYPLHTYRSAVFRRTTPQQEAFLPEEGLRPQQALIGMTLAPAIASFWEQEIGSIEIGKNADFVILNRDLEHTPEHDFSKIEITTTIKDGEVVFGNL